MLNFHTERERVEQLQPDVADLHPILKNLWKEQTDLGKNNEVDTKVSEDLTSQCRLCHRVGLTAYNVGGI